MIDYRFKVFLEVAAKKSFSKAAQELFVSQPSVSKQIKLLEAELGVALFERKGNHISLTELGEKLYSLLQSAKLIQSEIDSVFTEKKDNLAISGELKIGSSTTVSLYVFPSIMAEFHKVFPNATILLINRNSDNILKALQNYEIDLACVEIPKGLNSVSVSYFFEDEIIAVCSRNSPYRNEVLRKETIGDIPLALRENGSGTLAALIEGLKSWDIKLGDLKIRARLGGTEALKNYLIKGEYVGFLSRMAVQDEIENGELVEIKTFGLEVFRSFYFVNRKGEEAVGLTKNFIKMAKKRYSI
ncbi:LysR family transcriptional regulator [Mongoliitalea lutea]|uniref:Transcriptional regulator n=1 Tax=Mongoliitalea lutea TaxID=849756 RepID=A0A8J3D3M6_9BACT|nr:LysR family transcriptional regulator [Mongoliitalea lutea]GHB49337.1 transcriptional regulator [Mongoliitalea lutea]